ncbi:MAG: hypothetical protein INQ03_10375 [Candidatus Heimdallarchaeota archaeon]|nr:hypothetical protein [Candidatus Heimdallarchaeota archaeon]
MSSYDPLELQKSKLDITFYDVDIELDPEKNVFNTQQDIHFQALSGKFVLFTFYLHSYFSIEMISLPDPINEDELIDFWECEGVEYPNHQGNPFYAYPIHLARTLNTSQMYVLSITTHFDESYFGVEDEYFFHLEVGEHNVRAIGWPNGVLPIFTHVVAIPHNFTIHHPKDLHCAATTTKAFQEDTDGWIIDHFTSNRTQNTSPSFSCDRYTSDIISEDEFSVEVLYYEDEPLPEYFTKYFMDTFQLFTEYIGDTGDRQFQIAFIDVDNNQFGGTTRRSTIFLKNGYNNPLQNTMYGKVLMMISLFHELAHNYNGFVQGDSWAGEDDYFLWYQEGGATFLSEWACQKVIGPEAGNLARRMNLANYEMYGVVESEYTIENVPNSIISESKDTGVAYQLSAAVWDQLYLKLGEDTLFQGLKIFTEMFWAQPSNELVSIDQFFQSYKGVTDVDIENFLSQWAKQNIEVRIDIIDKSSKKSGDEYVTTVEIEVESSHEFEILTSIGYEIDGNEILENIQLIGSGVHTVSFTTSEKPSKITLDPEYRVPRLGEYSKVHSIEIAVISGISILMIFILVKAIKKIRRVRNRVNSKREDPVSLD